MTKDIRGDEHEEQAVARYRRRFRQLREDLGPHASLTEIEALLVEHENSLMSDTLSALTEGVSPPHEPESDT